jgi:hypothetical protein
MVGSQETILAHDPGIEKGMGSVGHRSEQNQRSADKKDAG